MLAAFALALVSSTACAGAADALGRAQAAWTAFRNGDFLGAPTEAQAKRAAAQALLARADAAARDCKGDRTAVPRAALHYEIDLVELRRRGGSSAALYLVEIDLRRLRQLGLDTTDPKRFRDFLSRYAEAQAETRGRLVVPLPRGSPPAAAGGSACPVTPAIPLGAIAPVVLDTARLRAPHGSTAVTVLVSSDGSVLSTLITASSGDGILDQAVSNAARLVTFVPARLNCRAVQGEYRFTYTFPQL